MGSTAGKRARVKVATVVGGPYTAVLGIDTVSHSIDGTNIDVSEMGVDYVQRIQGMKDGKLTVSGNLRPDDTNGQLVIRAAMLNDTDLFVQALPDGGTTVGAGFQQQMRPSNWKVDASQAGKVGWSCDLEGTGAISTT